MAADPVGMTNLLVAAVPGDPVLQLWSWGSSGTWVRIPTAGGPSFRTGFGLAFDQLRRTLVLFGGRDAAGTPLSDTWIWTAAGWASPQLAFAPSPRWGHGMAW